MQNHFDVIVIGGGHAGTEAAWAAAGVLGPEARVAFVTMDPSRIGTMSCNPAIGGLGKGQIVREIDALGGLMGLAADASGIMFKVLNASRGAAVRGPRCQNDKYAYAFEVQRLLSARPGITVFSGTVSQLLTSPDGAMRGVMLPAGAGVVHPREVRDEIITLGAPITPVYPVSPESHARCDEPLELLASAVVLTTGTFMRALMHTGERQEEGGRVGEGTAVGISGMLRDLGFELGRLKTGTPPRLRRGSIDWDGLDPQAGDERPVPFSDLTSPARFPVLDQITCRITETASETHELIRANLHRAPMYSGSIEAESGPRYCPSIEDKVVRFADRESHHVFLEPESLRTDEIYSNGISTSLPEDVQERVVHSMRGCEKAEIIKWGYAVEYDMVRPHQIDATTMTRPVPGLFLAGQINGTSGYEEAGGQGLLAGLNAARLARSEALCTLGRDQAYIGVMMDDLVTRTPREPYRMFTSRAEHRLLLRSDNADARLTPWGHALGLIEPVRWESWTRRERHLQVIRTIFAADNERISREARRQDTPLKEIEILCRHDAKCPDDPALLERVLTEVRYEGYIERQHRDVARQKREESVLIPADLEPAAIQGLRHEARDALLRYRPGTLGQAGRIEGITPSDLTLVAIAIKRRSRSH